MYPPRLYKESSRRRAKHVAPAKAEDESSSLDREEEGLFVDQGSADANKFMFSYSRPGSNSSSSAESSPAHLRSQASSSSPASGMDFPSSDASSSPYSFGSPALSCAS